LHLICDGEGTPLANFSGCSGQAVASSMSGTNCWVSCSCPGDKGYSAEWIRDWLKEHDIEAVIPYKTNEKGRRKKFNRKGYRRRNIIERCVSSLKWFRRVATRYEKLAIHYLGMVTLAIIFRLL
jgi:transposase